MELFSATIFMGLKQPVRDEEFYYVTAASVKIGTVLF